MKLPNFSNLCQLGVKASESYQTSKSPLVSTQVVDIRASTVFFG